jgi:hypothetical protein
MSDPRLSWDVFVAPSKPVVTSEVAERLWRASEEWTGARLG